MTTQEWYERTNKQFGDILDETASKQPEAEFIIHKNQKITYSEFQQLVNRMARGLIEIGVGKGERVALWMTNCPEWMVSQYAIYKIGAALLPINTRFVRDEVAYSLAQSETSTLILKDSFLGEKIDALGMLLEMIPQLAQMEPGQVECRQFPHLKRIVLLGQGPEAGTFSFDEVLDKVKDCKKDDVLQRAQESVSPFDVMNMVYTSGTTGFPKGGLSPHRTNCSALYQFISRIGVGPGDRTLLTVPLFTNFGATYVSALSVMAGMTIIMQEYFHPEEAMKAIEAQKVTLFEGAPAHYIMILNSPSIDKYDLSSLRVGVVGGAPAAPETVRAAMDKMGFKQICNAYGLSECGGLSTTTLADDSVETIANTVGVAFPSCQVKIVDPHKLVDLPPGEQGEIWLHDVYPGSAVGLGYYNMPAKTKETITEEGWFRTGDLGIMDENGYLRITGRVKDMFLVGGFNVYSVEIENLLHSHLKVKMAAVLGVPDERLGEVCMAYIEPKPGEEPTEEEIIEFCKKNMANYKVPRYVKFISTQEFPLTGSAKVRKFKLRERAIKELGLTE
jgi:fatty-acyl-CoA synthase